MFVMMCLIILLLNFKFRCVFCVDYINVCSVDLE